jgi:hypothetical protein
MAHDDGHGGGCVTLDARDVDDAAAAFGRLYAQQVQLRCSSSAIHVTSDLMYHHPSGSNAPSSRAGGGGTPCLSPRRRPEAAQGRTTRRPTPRRAEPAEEWLLLLLNRLAANRHNLHSTHICQWTQVWWQEQPRGFLG